MGKSPRDVTEQKDATENAVPSALSLTSAEPGDDGNIYLIRPSETPSVYVVSPGGSVLRRFRVSPPGEGFRATTVKVAGGRSAVEFYKDNPAGPGSIYIYSIVDAYTGEKIADYLATTEAGGVWACYSPNGFAFLSSRGNPPRLTLVKATP